MPDGAGRRRLRVLTPADPNFPWATETFTPDLWRGFSLTPAYILVNADFSQRQIVALPATRCALLALALGFTAARAGISDSAHPDFNITEIPMPDRYKTMGLAFLDDGRLALASMETVGGGEIPLVDSSHQILLIKGLAEAGKIEVKPIAILWHQVAGLTVAEGKLYASDRDGFYEIQNLDN